MKKLLLTTLISFSSIGYTQNSSETLKQATDLLNGGKPVQAYQLLQQGYTAKKASNQELFLLGMSAKQSGDSTAAKQYFEQLLARDPNAARVKLELAETVFQLGEKQYAKNLLIDVKKMNPPQGVLQNINGFIAQIDNPNAQRHSTKRGSWSVWGEVGFMVDSNANAAPAIDTVTMYNIPFTLSNNAKKTDDTAKVIKLGASHHMNLGKSVSWQTALSAHWQDYKKLSQLDSLQFSLQTGPSFQLSEKASLYVPFTGNRVKIGHQQSYYYYSYGLSPRLRYAFSPRMNLNSSLTISKRKYKSDNKPDVTTVSLTPSVQYALSTNDVINTGLMIGKTKSSNDFESNNSLGAFVNYQHQFDNGFLVAGSLSYDRQNYRGKEAAFSSVRKDKLFNASISITKKIKAINADLSLSISHSNNNSNLPLYDYKRNQTYLSLSKSF